MIDIYISIVSDLNSKVIVHVNELEYMTNLIQKIKENLERKYEHLRGLNGLNAKDLKRITGLDFNRAPASVSKALKNPMSFIPLKGRVNEHLRANDHLMCDIDSHDVWIQLKLMIEAEVTSNFVEVDLEVKIDKDMDAPMFQKVIQRLIIQIWNQHVQDKRDAFKDSGKPLKEKNYVLTDFRIVSIDVGMALQLLDIQSSERPNDKAKMKARKSKKTLFNMPDNKTVGEVFNYQNNLVKVACHFIPLRDLYIQQVMGGVIGASQSVQSDASIFKNQQPHNSSPRFGVFSTKIDNRTTKKMMKNGGGTSDFGWAANKGGDQVSHRPLSRMPDIIESNENRRLNLSPSIEGQQYQYIESTDHLDTENTHHHTIDQEFNTYNFSFDMIEEEETSKQINPVNAAKIPRMVTNRLTSQATILFSGGQSGSLAGETKKPLLHENDLESYPESVVMSNVGLAYLYAIIQGYIVLPMRNPVIYQEEINQQKEAQFDIKIIEDSKNQMVRNSSHMSNSLDSNINPLLNKNLKLSEIVEENDEGERQSFVSFKQKRVLDPKLQLQYSIIEEQDSKFEDETPMAFRDHRLSTVMMRRTDGTIIMRVSTEDDASYNQKQNRITKINDTLTDTEENETFKDNNEYMLTMDQNQKDSMLYLQETGDRKHSNIDGLVGGNNLLQPLIDNLNSKEYFSQQFDKNTKKSGQRHSTVTQNVNREQIQKLDDYRTSSKVQISSKSKGHVSSRGARLSGSVAFTGNQRGVSRKLSTGGKNEMSRTDQAKNGLATKENKIGGGNKILNFFQKLARINTNQKGAQKLTPQELGLDLVSEFEILQKIQLPNFLLHHEDYQIIQMPPVKNFVISEKEKSSQQMKEAFTLENAEQDFADYGGYSQGSQRKNFIIVTIIVFLAAAFAVGIYFAVDFSNPK